MEAPSLATPIGNLRIDPAQRRLTWEFGGSKTGAEGGAMSPRFLCRKEGRDPVWVSGGAGPGAGPGWMEQVLSVNPLATSCRPQADPASHSCSFPALSHCHVTDFTVFPEGREKDAAHVRFPSHGEAPPPTPVTPTTMHHI